MVTQDLTTYTVNDPNSDMTITSTTVTVDTMRRDAGAYLYYDFGANYFASDFTHLFDFKITAALDQGICNLWALTNYIGAIPDSYDTNSLLQCFAYRNVSTYYVYLREVVGGTNYDSTQALTLNTQYYMKIVRSGNTLTLYIYSDSGRTTLLYTKTLTLHTQFSYRYFYAAQGWSSASSPTATMSCIGANYDLGTMPTKYTAATPTLGSTTDDLPTYTPSRPIFLINLKNSPISTITSLLANPITGSITAYTLRSQLQNPTNMRGNAINIITGTRQLLSSVYEYSTTYKIYAPIANPILSKINTYTLNASLLNPTPRYSPVFKFSGLLQNPIPHISYFKYYSLDTKIMKTILKNYLVDTKIYRAGAMKGYNLDTFIGEIKLSLDELVLDYVIKHSNVKVSYVHVPEWINQAETINQSYFNRLLTRLEYTVRMSDSEKNQLDQMFRNHQLVSLRDTTNRIAGDVWIEKLNSGWTSKNWRKPWEVDLSLLVAVDTPPPPPPTPIEGSYWHNVAKPYYYNGWYYVLFSTKPDVTHVSLWYARTNGFEWSSPTLITTEVNNYNFYWSCMGMDDKMFIGWVNEYPYGTSSIWTKTGTINSDGTMSFNSSVFIENTAYSGGGCIRVAMVNGQRKIFFMASQHAGGNAADNVWTSTNDGASWSYRGYCGTFSQYYWWMHRLIPFEDGGKLIALYAPATTSDHYHIYSKYRDVDVQSCGTQILLGNFNDLWYIYAKAEGCLRRVGNWVHATWVTNTNTIYHKRVQKDTPTAWEDLGTVDTLTGSNFCASPVCDLDAPLQDVYIVYSDDYNIYYKKWLIGTSYSARETFYTATGATIQNLSVYPQTLNGKIIVSWNENIGGTNYVKCSAITV